MERLLKTVIAIGLTISSLGGFYSVALATHGGDHCTLGQHADLLALGYNSVQEAKICNGERLQPGADYRTEGDKIIDALIGKPETKATFCQTQFGSCALNEGAAGESCFCLGQDGKQYSGFAR